MLTLLLFSLISLATAESASPVTRDQLNQGFGQIYETLSDFKNIDKVFWFRSERAEVRNYGEKLSKLSTEFTDAMDKLASEHKDYNFKESGLPRIEKQKRELFKSRQVKIMSPITGKSGVEFEREFLLSTSSAIEQMIYLAKVLNQEESNRDLKGLAQNLEKEMQDLYTKSRTILKKYYFKK